MTLQSTELPPKYHACFATGTPDWEACFESLYPGSYCGYRGSSALGARGAGFEVRDSLLCWYPQGARVVWLLRRPLAEGLTLAQQALQTGTGVLNVRASRIPHAGPEDLAEHAKGVEAIRARGGRMANSWKNASDLSGANEVTAEGRWPANLLLVHHPECQPDACHPECPSEILGKQSGIRPGMSGGGLHRKDYRGGMFGGIDCPHTARGDTGTAARFFYRATSEQDLDDYLIRLISLPGHRVLRV